MSQAEEEVTPTRDHFVSKLFHEDDPQTSMINVMATLRFVGQALECGTFYDMKVGDEHGVAINCILQACGESLMKIYEDMPEREILNG